MGFAKRRLPRVLAPLLVAVAILGYFLGAHHTSGTPVAPAVAPTRVAAARSVLLEYPTTWAVSAAPPAIAALPIAHPLVLAPAGKSSTAGLVGGQFRSGDPGPLPSALLGALKGPPSAEVVNLQEVQAYRYSGVRLRNFDGELVVYVIPSPGNAPAALACYAARGLSAQLQECGQIVAKLTLIGRSAFDLTPDTIYAGRLRTLVDALDAQRVSLRRAINGATASADVARLAGRLAGSFAVTAGGLASLEPPLPAASEQAALAGALLDARASYTALASAAGAASPAGYEAAGRNVESAEAAVNAALENFVLLGYNHS